MTYSGVQISWQRIFLAGNQGNHQKGLIILPTAVGVLADFWVPNQIDS